MYLDYFQLREAPFSITPDPRFVFLSEQHREALAHLLFGVGKGGGGGFVQLTGDIGTGKTTICRLLLENLPQGTRVALILNPRQSPLELLRSIAEELGVDLKGTKSSGKGIVDRLNAFLLNAHAAGGRVVLILDEAQELSVDALEQVRLLTNLETETQKLLQIILLGQPELRDTLAKPELLQLAQRITARFHLAPLDRGETSQYLQHRLTVAGAKRNLFSEAAARRLHGHAKGVPRVINVLADRALMAAYVGETNQVDQVQVDRAAHEVLGYRAWSPTWHHALAVAVFALIAAGVWTGLRGLDSRTAPVTSAIPIATGSLSGANLVALSRYLSVQAPGDAERQLVQLRGLPGDADSLKRLQRCADRIQPGVRCLQTRATPALLGKMREPVLLRLRQDERLAWVIREPGEGPGHKLRFGASTVLFSDSELQAHWLGEMRCVYLHPGNLREPMSKGDRGASVAWLRAQLNLPPGRVFDAQTDAVVRALQAGVGLIEDGIVARETLMFVAANAPEPGSSTNTRQD
jgi:general secretion pathway protein A